MARKTAAPPPPARKSGVPYTSFSAQVHIDQQKYSRYVCDSRAIPHEIDGVKAGSAQDSLGHVEFFQSE